VADGAACGTGGRQQFPAVLKTARTGTKTNQEKKATEYKHSKIKLMVMAGALALVLDTAPAYGQAPVIASFGSNGELVCTNLLPGTVASVEWAASVTGPWTNTWANLVAVTADTNGAIRVSVPMFYRVRGVPAFPPFPAPSNMVWIAAGSFVMGSPASEPARYTDEAQHTVTLTKGFCMGKYEVTQAEYLAVMGNNPSYFTTNDNNGNPISPDLHRPVETVSWHDATNYCAQLTARDRSAGRLPAGYGYRLPTESEWEYACRAGTTTAFHYGAALRSGMANFDGHYEYPPCGTDTWSCYNPSGTYLARTTSVGSYAPNAWGLYDMYGNVFEWCQDWYGPYPGGSVSDPQGDPAGSERVIRGAVWYNPAYCCRSAQRRSFGPWNRGNSFGFRVVLAPGQ
jgi:formylglycine-generating enzyme required for sulfatase activity